MAKNITLGATLAIFLGVGLWNLLSAGPGNSETGTVVQARFAKLPMVIGQWQGEEVPVNEKHMKVSHAEAHLSRTYTNRISGDAVNVMILYGNPGDLGAHDPKVCYGGNGFDLAGNYAKRSAAGDVPNDFWAARFDKPPPNPAAFEVRWGWGTGNDWQAPDSPRLAFARQSRIYKIYLQQTLRESSNSAQGTTPMEGFLPEFLKDLRDVLMIAADANERL